MKDNSKGKMFLAGERGHTETEWFRSYNTFNFGGYQNQHKSPFGCLYVFNDDTLAGGKSIQLSVEEDSLILLLPIVGVIRYKDSLTNEAMLQAGERGLYFLPKGTNIEIANPLELELINFLQVWVRASAINETSSPFTFDINTNKNSLVKIVSQQAMNCFIGKFDGRSEGSYNPLQFENGLFIFIIEGAFEVQNRLLEAKDGLALCDVQLLEFEALSPDAILLILEIHGAKF